MKVNWKKWSIIVGSAAVATGLFALTPLIPSLGLLMIPVVLVGSVWSTVVEIKEENKKEETKNKEQETDQEEVKVEEPHSYPFHDLAEGFELLQIKSKDIPSHRIQQAFDNMYHMSLFLSENKQHITEEDYRFITQTCYASLEQLLSTYIQLEKERQEKEEEDILQLMEDLQRKMQDIKESIVQETEHQFQKTKRILQEKLKRY